MSQLPPMDLFGALLFQVAGQQLSVAATRRTLARIQAMFGGHLPAPLNCWGVEPDQLRAAGLSWRKASALRDLAERMSDGRLNPDVLSSLPDEELMAEFTAIPGIGRGPCRAPSSSRCSVKTSSCRVISRFARPSGPPIGSIISPRSRRSWPSPRSAALSQPGDQLPFL
jgi:hypothetical protein